MTGSRRYEAFTEGGWSAVAAESDYRPILANRFRAWCREIFIPSASAHCWAELVTRCRLHSSCMEGSRSSPFPASQDREGPREDMGGPSRSGSQVIAPLLISCCCLLSQQREQDQNTKVNEVLAQRESTSLPPRLFLSQESHPKGSLSSPFVLSHAIS